VSGTFRTGTSDDIAAEPPIWEIPAVLPREVIVARSDDIAISVGDLHVYSRGVLASVYVRFDPEKGPSNPAELCDFTSDFQKILDPTGLILGVDAGEEPPGSPRPTTGPPALHLDLRGLDGNSYLWRLRYWAFPLPTHGVVYSAQWLSAGLPRGSADVSAAEVSTLLTQVKDLRSPRQA
jgi:hypothetical protein